MNCKDYRNASLNVCNKKEYTASSCWTSQMNIQVAVIIAVLILLGFFVNSVLIHTFYRKPLLFNKPSDKFLLSLAVCGMFSGICDGVDIWPLVTSWHKIVCCKECFIIVTFFHGVGTVTLNSTIIHLTMIIFDRFLSLFFALRYNNIMTDNVIRRLLQLAWILPFITIAVIIAIHISMKNHQECTFFKVVKWYNFASNIVYMLIPLVMITCLLTKMSLKLRSILNNPPGHNEEYERRKTAQKRQIFCIFTIMFSCFMACTLPYCIANFMFISSLKFTDCATFLYATTTLRAVATFMNPIMYGLTNVNFRRAFRKYDEQNEQQSVCAIAVAASVVQNSL